MEFSSLSSVEAGGVDLLEFQWPWPPHDEAAEVTTCICYVVMKRDDGFVLCVPQDFLPEEVVQEGLENDSPEGPGPSLALVAPAVLLSEAGSWTAPEIPEQVPAMIIDLPGFFSGALSAPNLGNFTGMTFVTESPGLFPLATDVLRQARAWAGEQLGEVRSGYQTAEEHPLGRRASKAPPKAKRATVASIAQDQAELREMLRGLSAQFASFLAAGASGSNSLPLQGPDAPPPGLEAPPAMVAAPGIPKGPAQSLLSAPLASVLPPAQHVAKALTQVVGPPPTARQVPKKASPIEDHEARLAGITDDGDDPAPSSSSLAAAVLAQSQALVSLVGQLAQGGDPLLDQAPAASVRGAVGRQKLQQELAGQPGNASRRMDPSGLSSEAPTMVRYLERYGGFSKQRLVGLVSWQVAQALDHLHRGSPESAGDVLSLLMAFLDQVALDAGDYGLAWLLTLQADPPLSLFQEPQGVPGSPSRAFSPLIEQRWVTIAISYLKEVESISAKRRERPALPPPPKQPLADPGAGEAAQTKKQQRAAAWAAKRAAQAKA